MNQSTRTSLTYKYTVGEALCILYKRGKPQSVLEVKITWNFSKKIQQKEAHTISASRKFSGRIFKTSPILEAV